MSRHAAKHHQKAAEHHNRAAEYHRRASSHYEAGNYKRASNDAHKAHGHSLNATDYANEANKHSVRENSEGENYGRGGQYGSSQYGPTGGYRSERDEDETYGGGRQGQGFKGAQSSRGYQEDDDENDIGRKAYGKAMEDDEDEDVDDEMEQSYAKPRSSSNGLKKASGHLSSKTRGSKGGRSHHA